MTSPFMDRWGIPDNGEKRRRVLNLFFNYLEKVREPFPHEEELMQNYLGERVHINPPTRWHDSGSLPLHVEFLEPFKEDTVKFAERLEALMNSVDWNIERKEFIAEYVNNHPGEFGFVIRKEKGGWLTFKSGDEILDNALVTDSLVGLDQMTKTRKEFLSALNLYKSGQWTPSITKTRRTLEELLHEFLGNNKNLENNAEELAKILTNEGYKKENIDMLIGEIKFLDKKYNEIEKHKFVENDEKFAELFIYIAGSLIRVVLRIQGERVDPR